MASSLRLLPEELSDVPSRLAERYEAQADRYWDMFYRRNTNKFFKDRHYLHKEFPDLAAGPATLLEVGCGVGNTIFPLLETNPALRVYACDFAPSAVDIVRQHPLYDNGNGRVTAFVADITRDPLAPPPPPPQPPATESCSAIHIAHTAAGGDGPALACSSSPASSSSSWHQVPAGGCDLATLIFVLSAIHPQRMEAAVHNVARCLAPGGRLLFRDYAEGDLAQERLAGEGKGGRRLGHNFYVRGDGTRCYYFTEGEVVSLFASAGFVCDSLVVHERSVRNHKRDITMDRRWLQAIFTLPAHVAPPRPLEVMLAEAVPSPPAAGSGAAAAGAAAAGAAALAPAEEEALPTDWQRRVEARGEAAADGSGSGGGGGGGGVGLSGSSWLAGAAGRLASHLAEGPGRPSGRALLPDSLDDADADAAALSASPPPPPRALRCTAGTGAGAAAGKQGRAAVSPLCSGGGGAGGRVAGAGGAPGSPGTPGRRGLEEQLEAEFFATVQRDSAEVAAEEASCASVQLADLSDIAAVRLAAAAAAAGAGGRTAAAGGGGRHHGHGHTASSLSREAAGERRTHLGAGGVEAEVQLAAGVSFRCMCGVADRSAGRPAPDAAHLALATALLSSPAFLRGRTAVQLGPALPASSATPGVGSATTPGVRGAPPLLAVLRAQDVGANPHQHQANRHREVYGGVLPALAAVRVAARRVVLAEAGREGRAALAADLKRNAHTVVVERLRMAPFDWSNMAAAAVTAGPGTSSGPQVVVRSNGNAKGAWETSVGAGGSAAAEAAGWSPAVRRQLRDMLRIQPAGYDIVYGVDLLSGVASEVDKADGEGSSAALAAGRALFAAAAELLHPGGAGRGDCNKERVAGGGGMGEGCVHYGSGAASVGRGVKPWGAGVAAAGAGGTTGGRGEGQGQRRLLVLCVRAAWAAAHGLGLSALAAVCGWELLDQEQLAVGCGLDCTAVHTAGCALLAFRLKVGAAA